MKSFNFSAKKSSRKPTKTKPTSKIHWEKPAHTQTMPPRPKQKSTRHWRKDANDTVAKTPDRFFSETNFSIAIFPSFSPRFRQRPPHHPFLIHFMQSGNCPVCFFLTQFLSERVCFPSSELPEAPDFFSETRFRPSEGRSLLKRHFPTQNTKHGLTEPISVLFRKTTPTTEKAKKQETPPTSLLFLLLLPSE